MIIFHNYLPPLRPAVHQLAITLSTSLQALRLNPIPPSNLTDALIITLAIILITTILTALATTLFNNRDTRNAVVLIGVSGERDTPAVGKTALYKALRDGRQPKYGTVTSLQPNDATFAPVNHPAFQARWLDVPGHARLLPKLATFLSQARCIVMVIDAQTFAASARRDAHLLHTVLTNRCVMRHRTPVLLFVNKADVATLPVHTVRTRLEAELERARTAHGAALRSAVVSAHVKEDDQQQKQHIIKLGFDNEQFTFDHVPNAITFGSGSAHAGDVRDVIHFAMATF